MLVSILNYPVYLARTTDTRNSQGLLSMIVKSILPMRKSQYDLTSLLDQNTSVVGSIEEGVALGSPPEISEVLS